MSRTIVFLAALVAGLALLTAGGWFILSRTTTAWFERDLSLRSALAVRASERSLQRSWNDPAKLREVLTDITHDERIMSAAACAPGGELVASTEAYPRELSCRLLEHARAEGGTEADGSFALTPELPGGPVQVSFMPLADAGQGDRAIVLVHDLSFIARREQTTRNISIVAFFVLALSASVLTFTAARFARRGWTEDLRRALRGDEDRQFRGLVRDVRGLAAELARELASEVRGGRWSPARLRETLSQYLQGEKVVILANREPYIHEQAGDDIRVVHPASGLVTALEPVMRACSGVWVAHGSGSADRRVVDAHDRVSVPPGEESYQIRRVWLESAEEDGYYYGFSNEGLWPLCHVAHTRPLFRAEDFAMYERVNRRFADAVCQEVDSEDPIILVQDYHFALAPRMIRERIPRATIITFWHIPWPNAERVGICPWREELIAGMLGSSIVGFHTQQHCNNFLDSVDAFMETRIDRESNAVVLGGHRTLVRPYPISIEWPVHWLAQLPPAAELQRSVREELGLAPDALLGVGVDRLDYTKGIEERLLAVDQALRTHPELRGRFSFAQVAAPSRTKIDKYRELNQRVEALAQEINERWSSGSYRPIVLLRSHHEPAAVFRYYRAADLCYVSSLHDGMNLVAKEFVAARDDERGVLVLSQFTGAARDLTEALIVNPYDIQAAGEALVAALKMSPAEQQERMASMRRMVAEFNVYRWAGRMLVDAAELRRRERIVGRLSTAPLRERGGHA